MKKGILLILGVILLFGIEFSKNEKEYLKDHPVIYIAAMKYWPLDSNGESVHTNYMKLINKYGKINLQPLYYTYWSDAFNDVKEGKVSGILSLSYSKNREKWFYYTKPYNFTPYYIIVNKNSPIKSLKDLMGKKVYVAKNSIIREALKDKKINFIYTKKPFEELAKNKIDAVMLFYMPQNSYIDRFKIIKTYIDRYGEEHLGISKKYPQLYSIINKIIKSIPYDEIEKIKSYHYHSIKPTKEIVTQKIDFFDIFTKKEIVFMVLFLVIFILILFVYVYNIYVKVSVRKFFIFILSVYIAVVSIIVYEIAIYSYYSNKLLKIKSKSFNALFIIDKLNTQVIEWNLKYKSGKKNSLKLTELKIEGKNFSQYLNSRYFNDEEIKFLSNLAVMFEKLASIQKSVKNKTLNGVVYERKLVEFIEKIDELRDIVKSHNDREIKVIKEKLKFQLMLLVSSVLMLIVLSVFIFYMIKRKIYEPIEKLTENIIKGRDLSRYRLEDHNDEISLMIKEIIKLTKELHETIEKLQKHKFELEERVKKEVEARLSHEKMLIKQSKLALMGEMIDAIAHQWKQPLNSVYIRVGMILMDKDEINDRYLEEFVKDIYTQIDHMTQTLNEFRNFFREDKEDVFCMKRIIDIVLLLLKDELIRNKIEVVKDVGVNFCIEGNENEFKHLLIALISNAKDIFNERGIQRRVIKISTYEDEDYYYLCVCDNAGGIDEKIIDKIFDANFSARKGGTGVGLYLARKIAIKHAGFLKAENVENGAKFVFKISK